MARVPIPAAAGREFGRLVERYIELKNQDTGGYTQADLADKIGVARQLISHITVRGHVPEPDIIRRMAEELGAPYFELWWTAFHDMFPTDYEPVPREGGARAGEPSVARLVAEHPALGRLLSTIATMPQDQINDAVALLERMFGRVSPAPAATRGRG